MSRGRSCACVSTIRPVPSSLVLSADRRYFSRDDMAALARAIEEAAVEAATEPDTPTGLGAPIPAAAVR